MCRLLPPSLPTGDHTLALPVGRRPYAGAPELTATCHRKPAAASAFASRLQLPNPMGNHFLVRQLSQPAAVRDHVAQDPARQIFDLYRRMGEGPRKVAGE